LNLIIYTIPLRVVRTIFYQAWWFIKTKIRYRFIDLLICHNGAMGLQSRIFEGFFFYFTLKRFNKIKIDFYAFIFSIPFSMRFFQYYTRDRWISGEFFHCLIVPTDLQTISCKFPVHYNTYDQYASIIMKTLTVPPSSSMMEFTQSEKPSNQHPIAKITT
jgi:hypothetical protein